MDSVYQVPPEKSLLVFKALSNHSRYRIMTLLKKKAMNVSEIANALKISQPTVTTYINQLEEANLISTRLQRTENGHNKLCYLIYDQLHFNIENIAAPATNQSEYNLDMPVGHYFAIELDASGLLATEAAIIASNEDSSRFFHPIRMEAELLMIEQGQVRYLFPFNLTERHRILSLELSAEVNLANQNAQEPVDLGISINKQTLLTHSLTANQRLTQRKVPPTWYPEGLNIAGQLFTLRIDPERTQLNGQTVSNTRLSDLHLKAMEPIEVAFSINPQTSAHGGMVIFGKKMGHYQQDIRLRLVYETPVESSMPKDSKR